MGNKTKRQWTRRELEKHIKKQGWYFLRNTDGSHKIYSNGTKTISIQLEPNCMQIKRLFKENNLLINC